jgi:prolyl oligopeptidase
LSCLTLLLEQPQPDLLPRGYLRGFAFAPDCKSFYYVHEALNAKRLFYRAAYHHVLGTPSTDDREIFFAGEDEKVRLVLTGDKTRLAFFVYHFNEKTVTDIYFKSFEDNSSAERIFREISYIMGLRLLDEKILAITDHEAPNRRIVEIQVQAGEEPKWIDIVPESDMMLTNWLLAGDSIFVSYKKDMRHRIFEFDLLGNKISEVPLREDETVTMIGGSRERDELLLQTESFTEPLGLYRYSAKTQVRTRWSPTANAPLESANYGHCQVRYKSKDGAKIPMFLVGRRDVLKRRNTPTIMTSYGGYGVSMTPQFSVFVAFLMERGCLFALPNIRGGAEFGAEWHNAAKRRHRQTAYDDFLSAAEWLIKSGHTHPKKLAIFGGSNSGLLVGAAMTQRPDLFRAVVCMVPMLDMLRYHHFDNAHVWKEEFGTADDPDDFAALARYSPYHNVQKGVAYPATMMVSGDADRNCNPLHARKMAARLQAANVSEHPILLDYSEFRGHSPVLPLSVRINALTERMAFLCDQLQLSV